MKKLLVFFLLFPAKQSW